jgi:hypothetical protein
VSDKLIVLAAKLQSPIVRMGFRLATSSQVPEEMRTKALDWEHKFSDKKQ